MAFGDFAAILLFLGIFGVLGFLAYREKCCPGCGGFRTVKTVKAEYTPKDDKTDARDVFMLLITTGDHKPKSTVVRWIDRCGRCGYEKRGENHIEHY